MTATHKVSNEEFERDVERYMDIALQQTVIITEAGQDRWVLISVAEYERLLRQNAEGDR
jgi:PHD/YefM family antitoxin component YafN of YafNO toxin-antitoxin module